MPKGKRTSNAAMLLKGGADVKFSQKGGKKERKKERKKEAFGNFRRTRTERKKPDREKR